MEAARASSPLRGEDLSGARAKMQQTLTERQRELQTERSIQRTQFETGSSHARNSEFIYLGLSSYTKQ